MAWRGRRRGCRGWVPLTPMLAHLLARAVDATDFRPWGSGGATVTVPVAAHRQRACRRAMAWRPGGTGRLLADFRDLFGILAVQHAPVACTHECNSNLSTLIRTETVRDSSRRTISMDTGRGGQFGRLARECRARATRRASAHTHPIGHVHLVRQISTLGIEGPADRWSGDSPGTRHNK
jgi:hypothetical protein